MRGRALVEQSMGSGLRYRSERTTLLQPIDAEAVVSRWSARGRHPPSAIQLTLERRHPCGEEFAGFRPMVNPKRVRLAIPDSEHFSVASV
jgi:hypothetical protein